MYKRIPLDLSITLIWTVLTFIIVLIYDGGIFKVIMGIPTVLFIPGYAFVAALFPKRDDIYSEERITLSMIMSIVIISFLGLFLNFTLGIDMFSVVAALCTLEIITIFIATYRRDKLSDKERFSISFRDAYSNIVNGLSLKTTKNGLLTVILIFVIVVFAETIYLQFITPNIGERFTEFYILNSSARTDNFLTDLKVDSSYDYLVGIANYEYAPVNYTVRVALDKKILISENITLDHKDVWENNMTFLPDKEGKDMQLEFLLFMNNDFKEPYRKLFLWVNSTRSV